MGRFKHIILLISIAVSLSNSVPVSYNEKSVTENDDSEKVVADQIESVNEKVGKNLFEGDIVLDKNNSDVDGPQEGNEKRNARRDRSYIWKNKVVPYVIDQSLRSPRDDSPIIQAAIAEFRKHTCVRFVPRTNEKHWINFVKKDGCSSNVGKLYWISGGQDVSIGEGCAKKGVIMHELLHALGFWHEQSRPDRDQYVKILWENVTPGKEHNFNKYSHGTIDRLKATYDFGSLMHYGKTFFSSNGKPTIEAISNPNQKLGQRIGFSQTDIFEVNALYDCSGPSNGWSSWSDYGPCDVTKCRTIRQRFCSSSDVSNCPGANSYGIETGNGQCSPSECQVPFDCDFETDMCRWTTDPQNNYQWLRQRGKTSSSSTGPLGDATKPLDGTGVYVYAEASSPVRPNQKTELRSPMLAATSGRCLQFAYSMFGPGMGSLNVYVVDAKTGTKKAIFTKSGHQGQYYWHRAVATVTSSNDYKVVFEVIRGSDYTSDVALDDISIKDGKCAGQGPAPTTSRPVTPTAKVFGDDCNFDQDMCGWKTGPGTNTYSWTRKSGSTPTLHTGPNGDHTSGSGSYVYVETSYPAQPKQTATLVSKVFPPAPAGRCMSFYFHMYGETMGSLNVYIRYSTTVQYIKISGDKQDMWHRGVINLPNIRHNYQIVFESVRGSSYLSDIALDDITFTNGPCPKRI